jgi:anti-sigma factor RsiW
VNPSDETLMAYADGELDEATRRQVEESVAADPQLAQRLAAHNALRSRLRTDFDPVLQAPVPPHLLALVRSAADGSRPAQVLQFPARRKERRPWLQWSSLAASFVLGALLWQFASRLYPTGPITVSKGGPVASGVLARALDNRLASQQRASDTVQIGISFRSRQGAYCRTFQLRDSAATAGLACHGDNDWKVQVLAREEASSTAQGQYRQAASALPPSVLKAVQDAIAGEPLDAGAEAQARAGGWRAAR